MLAQTPLPERGDETAQTALQLERSRCTDLERRNATTRSGGGGITIVPTRTNVCSSFLRAFLPFDLLPPLRLNTRRLDPVVRHDSTIGNREWQEHSSRVNQTHVAD